MSKENKMPKTSAVTFNILLHVTILFTILSMLFKYYISGITTDVVNNEINSIIKDGIKNNVYNNSQNIINNQLNNIINNQLNNNPLVSQLNNNPLVSQLNITSSSNNITDNILNNTQLASNFSYDYYVKLFSKEDKEKANINKLVFYYLNLINILLVIILVGYLIYLYLTNTLSKSTIGHIIIENILTFICVGGFEYYLFVNVITKYVATPPELLYTSFINSLKKNNIV